MKRIKEVPKKCPNPLFEKWLIEWRDEARAKSSDVEHHFTKAITSLRKYPLPLESGRDCILLQHFGSKLCAMLDKKLKSHLAGKRAAHTSDTERDTCEDVESDILPKKSRSMEGSSMDSAVAPKKQFVPKKKNNTKENLSRRKENAIPDCLAVPADILEENGQKKQKAKNFPRRSREHSISSSGSSCCNDLPVVEVLDDLADEISKEAPIIEENATKKKSKVTRKLQDKRSNEDSDSRGLEAGEAAETAETLIVARFRMEPNSFDVLLLVDTHETAGGKTKPKDDATISELDSLKTPYEIRHLKIGDFAWIARCRDTRKELVLPYVVERKRMDDLASSIKDGRFHEQKFRLKQSGIPNIIYMIESYGKNQHLGIPLPTLLQASTNSLVQEDFCVKFTDSHCHSMQYLSTLTTLIEKKFKGKHLVSSTKEDLDDFSISNDTIALMEFKQFNNAASKVKTFKVKEMFVKQLLQLKGISVEKALAIVELYPTPEILVSAFQSTGMGDEKLLASIKVGTSQRQLGPALSKTIYELYTKRTLE